MNGKKQFAAKPTATGLVLLVTMLGVQVPLMAQALSQQLKGEAVEQLATEAREAGNAVRGAILFTRQDLHCTLCHHARDAKPMGPDLNSLGKHTTDVHLVEALLEPSKHITLEYESVVIATTAGRVLAGRIVDEGPEQVIVQLSSGDLARVTLQRAEVQEIRPSNVSAMPDNLVDQLNNRQEFLDLVRYLMELAAADARPPTPLHSVGSSTKNDGACHRAFAAHRPGHSDRAMTTDGPSARGGWRMTAISRKTVPKKVPESAGGKHRRF